MTFSVETLPRGAMRGVLAAGTPAEVLALVQFFTGDCPTGMIPSALEVGVWQALLTMRGSPFCEARALCAADNAVAINPAWSDHPLVTAARAMGVARVDAWIAARASPADTVGLLAVPVRTPPWLTPGDFIAWAAPGLMAALREAGWEIRAAAEGAISADLHAYAGAWILQLLAIDAKLAGLPGFIADLGRTRGATGQTALAWPDLTRIADVQGPGAERDALIALGRRLLAGSGARGGGGIDVETWFPADNTVVEVGRPSFLKDLLLVSLRNDRTEPVAQLIVAIAADGGGEAWAITPSVASLHALIEAGRISLDDANVLDYARFVMTLFPGPWGRAEFVERNVWTTDHMDPAAARAPNQFMAAFISPQAVRNETLTPDGLPAGFDGWTVHGCVQLVLDDGEGSGPALGRLTIAPDGAPVWSLWDWG